MPTVFLTVYLPLEPRMHSLARFITLFCVIIAIEAAGLDLRARGEPLRPSAELSSIQVTPLIVAKAKEWFLRFEKGNIDRSQLNRAVNDQLTVASVEEEGKRLSSLGPPLAFAFAYADAIGDAIGYNFVITFKTAEVIEAIAFDKSGKIAGIDFMIIPH